MGLRVNKRDNYIEWFDHRNTLLASADKLANGKWLVYEYHHTATILKDIQNFKKRYA